MLRPVLCGCGGSPEIEVFHAYTGKYMATVTCKQCGIKFRGDPFMQGRGEAVENAVSGWNKAMKRLAVDWTGDIPHCPWCNEPLEFEEEYD